MQAHPLSQQPLDPVSNDRVSHFLGHRDPESSNQLGITSFSSERQHGLAVQLDAIRLDREELAASTETHLLRDFHFFAIVTEIRLRPFARRRRSTSRPPRVFLRARKPCVRLRLLLCGWYVRFTASLRRLRSGGDTQPKKRCQGARMPRGLRSRFRALTGVHLMSILSCGVKRASATYAGFSPVDNCRRLAAGGAPEEAVDNSLDGLSFACDQQIVMG